MLHVPGGYPVPGHPQGQPALCNQPSRRTRWKQNINLSHEWDRATPKKPGHGTIIYRCYSTLLHSVLDPNRCAFFCMVLRVYIFWEALQMKLVYSQLSTKAPQQNACPRIEGSTPHMFMKEIGKWCLMVNMITMIPDGAFTFWFTGRKIISSKKMKNDKPLGFGVLLCTSQPLTIKKCTSMCKFLTKFQGGGFWSWNGFQSKIIKTKLMSLLVMIQFQWKYR